MRDNNALKDFINAVGTLTEVAKILNDSLKRQGFNDRESLYLTSEFLKSTFGERK